MTPDERGLVIAGSVLAYLAISLHAARVIHQSELIDEDDPGAYSIIITIASLLWPVLGVAIGVYRYVTHEPRGKKRLPRDE